MSTIANHDGMPTKGTAYQHITASGSSRMLNGNVYGNVIYQGEERSSLEEQCLQSLAFPDMMQRRDDISPKTENTCGWILENRQYTKWCEQGGLLWIKGRAGTGKSTLMRSIVRNAEHCDMTHTLSVSHFFHKGGSSLQSTILGLLRSLLHQLLSRDQQLLLAFIRESNFEARCRNEGRPGTGWNWTESELRGCFSGTTKLCASKQPVRFYVDALDEAGEAAARELMIYCEQLRASVGFRISVCLSCRPYPDVVWSYDYLVVVEKHNHDDMTTFLDSRFSHARGWGAQRDAEEIKSLLLSRAAGVFQWVVLVTYRILQLRSESIQFILHEIEQVPKELHDLYEEMLGQLSASDRRMAFLLLRWITFAVRPLSLEELRYAVTLDPATPLRSTLDCQRSVYWCSNDQDMSNRVRRLSRGLIRIDKTAKGDRVVGFDHESVQDYMLKRGIAYLQAQDAKVPPEDLAGQQHRFLSICCVRLLGASDVLVTRPVGFDTRPNIGPFVAYAVRHWAYHAAIAEASAMSLADLIRITEWPACEIWSQWHSLEVAAQRSYFETPLEGTTLQHVAARFGLESVLRELVPMIRVSQRSLFKSLTHGQFQSWRRSDALDLPDAQGLTPLALAAKYGQESIAKLLVNTGRVNVNSSHPDSSGPGGTPLAHAARGGSTAIVKLLLRIRKVRINGKDQIGHTPLLDAAGKGHEEIVQLLIDTGKVDVNVANKDGITPLAMAAKRGHLAIVQRLLATGNANADSRDKYNQTPFSQAVASTNEEFAKVLLDHCSATTVDLKNHLGETPLGLAASIGLEGMVRLLLKTGKVDIDSQTDGGPTPFSIACWNQHLEIVKLFLSCGKVNVNIRDSCNDQTPLALAATSGREKVVKLLIADSRVEMSAKDVRDETPLALAAQKRHEGTVKMLLESGRLNLSVEYSVDYSTLLEWVERTGLFQADDAESKAITEMLEQYGIRVS